MRLSQSVVLWHGRGNIQKIALFGKRPSPYYGKNSSDKQREMTVHHYFKTWRSVNPEHFKNFESFFKCSHKKTSSAMMKLALMRTATGMEDPELPLLQNYQCQKLQSKYMLHRVQQTHLNIKTVQRRLCESDLHGWITTKKPLLKDTNNNKRLAWAKKHEQWTLDRWKSVPLVWWVQFWDFWFQPPLWDAE